MAATADDVCSIFRNLNWFSTLLSISALMYCGIVGTLVSQYVLRLLTNISGYSSKVPTHINIYIFHTAFITAAINRRWTTLSFGFLGFRTRVSRLLFVDFR